MRKRTAVIIILMLLATLLMGACSSKSKNNSDEASEVKVYYLDSKTSEIVSENYTMNGIKKSDQVKELLAKLKKSPENMIYKSALPDGAIIKNFSFSEDGQLTINFEPTYSTDVKGIPEVLCRAVIVKTLSQIGGVDYIVFDVNGQPLVDENGNRIMMDEDFIMSTGAEANYKATLYYASKNGKQLVETTKNIYYTGTDSIEELVIQQLINGPTELGMYNTIPEGTTLLDVTTKDGICYVDFNEKFLEKLPNITDEVAIYSVVNSLVELPNVNKVQFLINGEVQKTYRENTKFDISFDRNLDIIEGDK